jgi:hypothetical protein
METYNVDLNTLVNSNVDLISGRAFGEKEAEKFHIMDHVNNNEKIVIYIDDQKVKAINDSFIKGFFSDVFKILKTKERVQQIFEVEGNDYFIRLFHKNWTILEALYGSSTNPSAIS